MAARATRRRAGIKQGTKPEPRRERRRAGVHDGILAAAARLVSRYGYSRVTIEAVAATAGAGKQTIYRWWPSKALLYLEVYQSLLSAARLQVDTGSVRRDLRAFMARVSRAFAGTAVKAIAAGLAAEAPRDRAVAAALTAPFMRGRQHLLRDILERGRERGEIRRNADLDLAVEMLSAAIWSRLVFGRAKLDARFAARLTALHLSGIAVRP